MSIRKKIIPWTLAGLLLFGQVGGTLNGGAVGIAAAAGEVVIEDSPVPLSAAALPTPSGTSTAKNDKAIIDYSNIQDGYVMVQFTASTSKRLKAQVIGPSGEKYNYNLTAKQWATFPLNDGDGSYKVTVFENTVDTKYASVVSTSFTVKLSDQFAPYLRPNQYVDYANAPKTVAQAASLVKGVTEPLKQVEKIYDYVVNNFTYDTKKASSVQTGYLPVLDTILAAKTGICFDYAGLMTGMLRSVGIPSKLVIGYAGTQYHAWINVWTKETGWIENAIYFNGSTWERMDPTFASSSKQSEAIMKYIGDGSNYKEMFTY